MRRAAVSVFVVVLSLVGAAACGNHEAEPTVPTFDFTPAATITVNATGIGCSVSTDVDSCQVGSGDVLIVENTDDIDHRLLGTNPDGGNVFDTGVMQPDDETTVVLSAAGVVTVTDSLWPEGESPTIDITVTPAPADS